MRQLLQNATFITNCDSTLTNAPKNMFHQKVLEAYYIVLEKPTLNEQLEPDRLNLFRNGVT